MKTIDLAYISLFTAMIVLCSWISIPLLVPITLQIVGVNICFGVLGLKKGIVSLSLYIILGLIGVPVFANFNSGIGVIVGPTGGFIIGFIFIGLSISIGQKIKEKSQVLFISMIVGLLICYLFGCLWFALYNKTKDFGSIILVCVAPFVLFDIIKCFISLIVINRIKKIISRD